MWVELNIRQVGGRKFVFAFAQTSSGGQTGLSFEHTSA